jgi:hypothetical protein
MARVSGAGRDRAARIRARWAGAMLLALLAAGCAPAGPSHPPVIVNGWCDPYIAGATEAPGQPLDFGLCYPDGL